MKRIFLVLCCFSALLSTAQLPSFQWANKMVGSNSRSIATDALGNVYMLGNMGASSTLDVDPGPGVYNLNGADGTVIIYKLNTAGGFVWAKQLPGVSPECIRVDAAENVYLVGHYTLTQDFDPGPGVFNLTTVNQNDIFTLKLDAAGNFLWAKSQGGAMGEIGYSIAISAAGNVYTTGYFSGTADFDPGAGVFNMTAGILGDTYISALSAEGNFLWAKHIAGGFNQAHNMTINDLGYIIIAGQFSGTKDLDPGAGVFSLTSAGASDIFILKLDGTGNFIWAKSVGGIGSDGDGAVALDLLGNVYVTGSFPFTADFDPGPATFNFTATGSTDMFVLKLNASGNFVWAKQMSGTLADVGNDITTDATGNVYTTGIFQDVADFDPGPGIFNLTTHGSNDIFISKLDTEGNFVWAVGFGAETSEDEGNAIIADPAGNIYAAGTFLGQVDFDPGPGESILLNGNTANYVLKFGPGTVLPLTLLNFSASLSANGILLKWQTAHEINTKDFEIEWSVNGSGFKKIAVQMAAGNSNTVSHYTYFHTTQGNGENYYRLKMIDRDGQYTFSKIIRISTTLASVVIAAFPNPVIDLLKLDIRAMKNETVLFKLHSADGKLVSSRSFNIIKGSNQFNWNLSSVPAGKYFIVSNSDQFRIINIIKK
jgi:Beta-propeller repeat